MIPDPDQLELAKEGLKETVKQVFRPFQEIVQQLAGPSATELGLMWGDAVRVWRLKRAVRLFQDLQQVASEAHLRLNPGTPRLLFPILEAATLEEDEDLHRRWVALLANASVDSSHVLPCFPDILRQLTPDEARFLDRAYDEAMIDSEKRRAEFKEQPPGFIGDVGLIGISSKILSSVHPLLINNLERLNLVTRINVPLSFEEIPANTFAPANRLYVSELGKAFVSACRLPR